MSGGYITGHCGIGLHEGTRPKSPSGKPMKVCTAFDVCKCNCHLKFNKLFEETETPRVGMQNPNYVPVEHAFIYQDIVTIQAGVDRSIMQPLVGQIILESAAPGVLPGVAPRSFSPTPTGRAARGELELWVKEVTDAWTVDPHRPGPCTPTFICAEVARVQGISEPSTGAVAAVLYRWRTFTFANVTEKPLKFESYTDLGLEVGLDGCKQRAKRAKRQAVRF